MLMLLTAFSWRGGCVGSVRIWVLLAHILCAVDAAGGAVPTGALIIHIASSFGDFLKGESLRDHCMRMGGAG